MSNQGSSQTKYIEFLVSALTPTHDGKGHGFFPDHMGDPRCCRVCGWLGPGHPKRDDYVELLEALRSGEYVIKEQRVTLVVVFFT